MAQLIDTSNFGHEFILQISSQRRRLILMSTFSSPAKPEA